MMLSLTVFLPLVGAIVVLLAGGRGEPRDREPLIRNIALLFSAQETVSSAVTAKGALP